MSRTWLSELSPIPFVTFEVWHTFTVISSKYLQPTVSRLSYHVFWNTPCSVQQNQTLLQKLRRRRIAYSSHKPSASSCVCVWQSSFFSNVHDIMDDHFLNGNNLISKNVLKTNRHTHTPSYCGVADYVHIDRPHITWLNWTLLPSIRDPIY